MRIALIVFVATIGVSGGLIAPGGGGVPPAVACSIGGSLFDGDVRSATFAGIIETTSVGDGMLREPKLPTFTPTPEGSETATPSPTSTPLSRDAAETATAIGASLGPPHYAELVGQSAHAVVIERINGDAPSEFDIDLPGRQHYERGIREREAGYGLHSCSLISPPRYEAPARYLVILNDYTGTELNTVRRFRVDGDAISLEGSYLDLPESLYLRYMPGVAAQIQDNGDGTGARTAYITAPTVPLDAVLTMMRATVRGIVPPEIGNAGLAANR